MERQMENVETGYKDPSIQILPTLGPKVCKYYLHWAIWSPRLLLYLIRSGVLKELFGSCFQRYNLQISTD